MTAATDHVSAIYFCTMRDQLRIQGNFNKLLILGSHGRDDLVGLPSTVDRPRAGGVWRYRKTGTSHITHIEQLGHLGWTVYRMDGDTKLDWA